MKIPLRGWCRRAVMEGDYFWPLGREVGGDWEEGGEGSREVLEAGEETPVPWAHRLAARANQRRRRLAVRRSTESCAEPSRAEPNRTKS